MTKSTEQRYHSFLIRCWLIRPSTPQAPPVWRLELQEVSDQSREHHFSSFNELVNFLSAEILIMPYDDPELPAEND
ncbi:MAG: hypothetical protein IPJ94_23380 [Chloroflexi bacterium]|nr:hypothetical protein [Chloroflexota bacterium]MBK8931366.1 hypothetical protein [Chloroflexota bacterium]